MKYSICNTQLLPKAADLKKKAFDEFRLINMSAIVLLKLLSQNAMKSFLTSSVQVSVSLAKKPGDSGYEIGDDRKKRQRTIRKVMVGVAKPKEKIRAIENLSKKIMQSETQSKKIRAWQSAQPLCKSSKRSKADFTVGNIYFLLPIFQKDPVLLSCNVGPCFQN